MLVNALTRHFECEWSRWVGSVPTVEELNRMIVEGTHIRRQMEVRKILPDGNDVYCVILAEYWLHWLGAIVRIDRRNRAAVTVITPEKIAERQRERAARKEKVRG